MKTVNPILTTGSNDFFFCFIGNTEMGRNGHGASLCLRGGFWVISVYWAPVILIFERVRGI